MRTKILSFARRWWFMAVALALTTLLALLLQNVQKTELINRTGQTFEKGVVTEVLVDNLQPDGTRVGEQRVAVRMTTGVRKGQVIEMTSSAGYLFGATCTPGLRVIVMQSVAGDTTVSSVYSQDRGGVLLLFAALYLVALIVIGGKQGLKGRWGWRSPSSPSSFVPAACVSRLAAALDFRLDLRGDNGGYHVFYRRPHPQNRGGKRRYGGQGCHCGLVAAIFGAATGISGWNVSDIETLITLWNTNGINVGELLFAGLLISSLGAVMDVAMSVASSMGKCLRRTRR